MLAAYVFLVHSTILLYGVLIALLTASITGCGGKDEKEKKRKRRQVGQSALSVNLPVSFVIACLPILHHGPFQYKPTGRLPCDDEKECPAKPTASKSTEDKKDAPAQDKPEPEKAQVCVLWSVSLGTISLYFACDNELCTLSGSQAHDRNARQQDQERGNRAGRDGGKMFDLGQ